MKATRLTLTGPQETVNLSDVVFGETVNNQLLAQAVRVYQARNRQGTSATKTRANVLRTKKKWFKQKGTGNARHGARSSNIFVGGGVSHGPNGLQNWSLTLPKKMRQQAIVSAFAAQNGNVYVSEALNEVKKNKEVRGMISQVREKNNHVLVILPEGADSTVRALRNMEAVTLMTAHRVNALDIVQADKIVIADTAIAVLEHRVMGKANTIKKESVKRAVKADVKPTAKEAKATKTAKAKPAKPAATKTKKTNKEVTK
jgi:large subunit ribosomal protein L4